MNNLKYAFLGLAFLTLSCMNGKIQSELASNGINQDVYSNNSIETIEITPINHATMVLSSDNTTIYVDPVGSPEVFVKSKKPNFVLITDIHGDHLSIKTLEGLDLSNTYLIVPKAVADKLPKLGYKDLIIMDNGSTKQFDNLKVEAIPMYNLREEALKFHEKGRGNGYVVTLEGKRIYISGDTEDIPEMRNLKNIDMAFVCMNLPYTMTVESAASAVLDFKPKKVYPYHYRGTDGMSDINTFKYIVEKGDKGIETVQLDWYN